MNIATAFVEVRLDRKAAEADAKTTASGVLRTMTDIFKAGIFIAGIKQSIMDASNLNETLSKTRTVFGDTSKEIEAFADTAASKLGLSKQAAMDAASTFAIFGKSAGLAGQDLTGFSSDLVTLSADFASFFNTSPEQAIFAIGAALRGESEPIRAYGVLLNDATLKQTAMEMGLYSGKGALDQHAKVLAAQKEILKQAGDATGDFARTSDGLANSQRIAAAEAQNARASFGDVLLPVYERVVKITTALVAVFGDLPAPIQTGIVALIGFVALSGPLKNVKDLVTDMVQAFIKAGVSAATLATATAGVSAVIGAAVIIYQVYSNRKKEAENRTRDFAGALGLESNAQNEALVALAQNDKMVRRLIVSSTSLGLTTADLAQYMRDGTGPAKKLTDAWAHAQKTANGTYPELDALGKAMGMTAGKTFDAEGAARDLAKELENLREAEIKRTETEALVADLTQVTTTATKEQAGANIELQKALDETAKAQKEAAEKAQEHKRALQDLWDEVMGQIDAQHAYERAVDDSDAALADYVQSVKDAKGDVEAIDDASRDAAQTMWDTAEAYAAANGETRNTAGGVDLMIESLYKQAIALAPGDPLRTRLLGYIGELQTVPASIATTLSLTTGGDLTRPELKKLMEGEIPVKVKLILSATELKKLMEGRASGGPVRGGQTYLVGEEGPELFTAPFGGGTIIPNARTEQLVAAARSGAQSAASSMMATDAFGARAQDASRAASASGGQSVNVTFGDIVNTVDYDAAWRTTAFYLASAGVG